MGGVVTPRRGRGKRFMEITYRCRNCDAELNAPADTAGRMGMCPDCRTTNEIPKPGAEPEKPMNPRDAAAAFALARELSEGPAQTPKRKSGRRHSTRRRRRVTTGPVKAIGHSKAERRRTQTRSERPSPVRAVLLWLVVIGTCSALIYVFSAMDMPSFSTTGDAPPTTIQP